MVEYIVQGSAKGSESTSSGPRGDGGGRGPRGDEEASGGGTQVGDEEEARTGEWTGGEFLRSQ